MTPFRIGIDFDNTIACYDGVFHKAALEKNLIPPNLPTSKSAVRDYLRSINQEPAWTELQGYIYGARMDLARPYPGVREFFAYCQAHKIPTFTISHKTRHPFLGPRYDLHKAAHDWLTQQSFTSPFFFELTLEEKLQRISTQNCTHFIDDLPEVFAEKTFPQNVQKILFDPHQLHSQSIPSWEKVLCHLTQS